MTNHKNDDCCEIFCYDEEKVNRLQGMAQAQEQNKTTYRVHGFT